MPNYVAILRGINVGGKNAIKMQDLRLLMQDIACTNVDTYIQSGNIVFMHKKKDAYTIAEIIQKTIATKFALQIPVIVLAEATLQKVILQNTLLQNPNVNAANMHITFLATAPSTAAIEALQQINIVPDTCSILPQAVYLHCPTGYSNCKFTNAFLEKKLQVLATTRNLKTCNTLLQMLQAMPT